MIFRQGLSLHKDTLEKMELVFRGMKGGVNGDAGNPHTKQEDPLPKIREAWRDNGHILGSLAE